MDTNNKPNADEVDLESLAKTLSDLRKSVRANNPILKVVASSRLYPALTLVLGVLMGVYCLANYLHPSLAGQGSSWILIALFFIESAPWLWTAFLFLAVFGLFGIVGLTRARGKLESGFGA